MSYQLHQNRIRHFSQVSACIQDGPIRKQGTRIKLLVLLHAVSISCYPHSSMTKAQYAQFVCGRGAAGVGGLNYDTLNCLWRSSLKDHFCQLDSCLLLHWGLALQWLVQKNANLLWPKIQSSLQGLCQVQRLSKERILWNQHPWFL